MLSSILAIMTRFINNTVAILITHAYIEAVLRLLSYVSNGPFIGYVCIEEIKRHFDQVLYLNYDNNTSVSIIFGLFITINAIHYNLKSLNL